MKLAEALIERSELQKINGQIIKRIQDNAKVQEGDTPGENPEELITVYEKNMVRLLYLVQRINETNNKTSFDNNMNISDAIAMRDCIGQKIRSYRIFYEASAIKQDRYYASKQEIKFIRVLDIRNIQGKINELSKEYRELDTKLQGINWNVDLL